MPEIRLKSQQKHPSPTSGVQPRSRSRESTSTRKSRNSAIRDENGDVLRRTALAQLTAIQINTAGLSGPYRSDEETMERVCGNHAAVRSLRIVLRRALIIPRRGPLRRAILAWMLEVCGGKHGQAARMLGITVRELRRVLDSQRSHATPLQPRISLVK